MTDVSPAPSSIRIRQVGRKICPSQSRKKKKPAMVKQAAGTRIHQRKFPRTQYYFTKGHEHMGEPRNVNEEQSPFTYPTCSLMFSYFQYWKAWKQNSALERRGASYKEQQNYNTTQARDILHRLRVDVEIEALDAKKHKDPDETIAMTDVDPGYFEELGGRVGGEKFSLQKYVDDTREIFKARLLTGQELDDCLRIDQQFVEEQRRLDKIRRLYRRYASGFEEYLSKDHEKSMKILAETEKEIKLTNMVTNKRNELLKEFGKVRLEVYFWEESWRMVKMCQRFLYHVAPISWRMENDWIHRTNSAESDLAGSTVDLFGRYRMTDEVTELENLIELFNQDVIEAGPIDLYFEDPFDIIKVFRAMETQNLNALIHLESLAAPMSEMLRTIAIAEEQIKSEVNELTETINDLQDSIKKTEARAVDLENTANELLQGIVRELVCSDEVLCLQVFIEDTYEGCVGPNDANLDSFSMMKWIEKIHEDLNLQLDTLPPDVVQACEKEGFRQETKAMRETEEAARKFELMHRLLDSLKRMMEPPLKKGRQLIWRSTPIQEKIEVVPPPPDPNEEEMQYLTYFTKYCNEHDFTTYIDQFPDDFDLSFEPKRPSDQNSEDSDFKD